MSACDLPEPQRFSLMLDPGLVLERMILRRLSALKRKRRQDWLRSLLVHGFLAEGQWIRSEFRRDGEGGLRQAPQTLTTAFGSWLQRSSVATPRAAQAAPGPVSTVSVIRVRAEAKPFAQLRKVIG